MHETEAMAVDVADDACYGCPDRGGLCPQAPAGQPAPQEAPAAEQPQEETTPTPEMVEIAVTPTPESELTGEIVISFQAVTPKPGKPCVPPIWRKSRVPMHGGIETTGRLPEWIRTQFAGGEPKASW
ncbi:MAG: hypothetical protein R3E79_57880 [Caldilineaceae bacterium]